MGTLGCTLLEPPTTMSALSDREAPSENSFSLPPISIKMTASPSNESDLDFKECDEMERGAGGGGGGRHYDHQSSFSSRASSFMFSRRSSRISNNSASSSPTKLPTIDWHKSNSAASFASARSSNMRRSFREVKSDRMDRVPLCKSPSCPTLQWDEYEDSASGSVNGDIQVSVHPSTVKQYGGDDMHLPSIFSSSNSKQNSKRDQSLPPLAIGDALTTPRFMDSNKESLKTRKTRRDLVASDNKQTFSGAAERTEQPTSSRTDKPHPNSGFLVPISESDKVTNKAKNNNSKKRQKKSPQERSGDTRGDASFETNDRHDKGISGLLHIEERRVLPSVQTRARWNIVEEDEAGSESGESYDEDFAIAEIAKENVLSQDSNSNGATGQKKNSPKNKKL